MQYNIEVVLSHITERLANELPSQFSSYSESGKHVLGWLGLAEELQLDRLKDVCLKALKEPLEPDFGVQAEAGCLDDYLQVRHRLR
jgi:hypothetical protein